ncbi:MAG: hypothetical protein JNM66_13510 [Bryobacterales bacterium]|nr:hypothetical protein [Bryobacterales bacterium]
MFTPEQRAKLRSALLERAASDPRITAAAITGSAAINKEDRWSDIDLAFAISSNVDEALTDWTTHLTNDHGAVHHLDMHFGLWTYRVFLLPGALQVDLAFVPAADFRALSPAFQIVFGTANEPAPPQNPAPATIIGFGWLYAIHARTSIARGHSWQAQYMINGLRDQWLILACLRHGLPTAHGRGYDLLPLAELERWQSTALRDTIDAFLREAAMADEALAARLTAALTE